MDKEKAGQNRFNLDVDHNQSYLYTTPTRLSSVLANRRMTDTTLEMISLKGKKVLDMGCGDGTYSIELFDQAGIDSLVGVDPAEKAVEAARARAGTRKVEFHPFSAYQLPYGEKEFDAAILRGVLHHMDQPRAAIREALRVAKQVFVLEPNGYNPGLKFLEKFSKYHVEHQEKSYSPAALNRWVVEADGVVEQSRWIGFVPMFCPNWAARFMKSLEPAVEKTPLVKQMLCAVYAFSYKSMDLSS